MPSLSHQDNLIQVSFRHDQFEVVFFFQIRFSGNISSSSILFQRGESVTVYCVPSHMIVFVFCFVLFSSSYTLIVLSLQLRWAAKFIVVNHPP